MIFFKPAMLGAVLGAVALSGCSGQRDKIAFDGQYFRTKIAKIDGQRDVFTVTISPVSASLEGAREAGRYEATRYCVNTYGNSNIIWTVGPDTPPEALRVDKDTMVFQGKCPQ